MILHIYVQTEMFNISRSIISVIIIVFYFIYVFVAYFIVSSFLAIECNDIYLFFCYA